MRIVGQNAHPVFRGAEKAIVLVMAGLQQRGHQVLLVCANESVAHQCAEFGVPTAVLKLSGDLRADRAVRFAYLLRRFRADAAVLGSIKKVLTAAAGARLAAVPRIVCRVGSVDMPDSWKYRFVFRHLIDVTVLNTVELRMPFLAADPQLDPASVVVIPTGVQPPLQHRAASEVRRELGLPPGARVIGSLAHLSPLKCLWRIVDSLPLLPDVHWVHAGPGREQAALEQRARSLNVHDRVHLLGWYREVGDLLGLFDLYVVTSDLEGMSNSMLEALASGVPVVSTPVNGAQAALEPLPDGTAPGVVVEPVPHRIAAAISAILSDPDRHARMRAAALQRARARFAYDRMIDDYEAVLAGTPPAAASVLL